MIPYRSRFETYNDGVLVTCERGTANSDFGAVRNVSKKSELRKILKLAFKQLSMRDEDVAFAENAGHTLSLKVKTRIHPDVDSSDMVLIENTLYSIVKLDSDRPRGEMYLYLEEVRKVD